jgi:hypothetical protein
MMIPLPRGIEMLYAKTLYERRCRYFIHCEAHTVVICLLTASGTAQTAAAPPANLSAQDLQKYPIFEQEVKQNPDLRTWWEHGELELGGL